MYRRFITGATIAGFSLLILVSACGQSDPVSPGESAGLSAGSASAGIYDHPDNDQGSEYGTAIGYKTTATGKYATAMGYLSVASGKYSTALGNKPEARGVSSVAGGSNTVASGKASTAFGHQTVASGTNSVSMGSETMASGFHSVALGSQTVADGDYSTAFGQDADTNGHTGAFVYGDRTGGPTVEAERDNQIVFRASGGIKFWTDSNMTVGVELDPSGSGWDVVSDVNKKENFRALDGNEVLRKLAAMDIVEWNYRTQDEAIRHVGPMAQDFYAAFGLGSSEKSINTVDADGIALLAIQALERRNSELQQELNQLHQRLAEIEQSVALDR